MSGASSGIYLFDPVSGALNMEAYEALSQHLLANKFKYGPLQGLKYFKALVKIELGRHDPKSTVEKGGEQGITIPERKKYNELFKNILAKLGLKPEESKAASTGAAATTRRGLSETQESISSEGVGSGGDREENVRKEVEEAQEVLALVKRMQNASAAGLAGQGVSREAAKSVVARTQNVNAELQAKLNQSKGTIASKDDSLLQKLTGGLVDQIKKAEASVDTDQSEQLSEQARGPEEAAKGSTTMTQAAKEGLKAVASNLVQKGRKSITDQASKMTQNAKGVLGAATEYLPSRAPNVRGGPGGLSRGLEQNSATGQIPEDDKLKRKMEIKKPLTKEQEDAGVPLPLRDFTPEEWNVIKAAKLGWKNIETEFQKAMAGHAADDPDAIEHAKAYIFEKHGLERPSQGRPKSDSYDLL